MTPAAQPPAPPRLLLVEDDASIRQFVQMALEELPVQVLACASLAAARSALAESPPPFLVLLDLMLPDGRGPLLLDEPAIRAAAPHTAWVVFSAGVQASAREALLARGVTQVLRKPVSLDELLDCVARHLPPSPARPTGAAADHPSGATAAQARTPAPLERGPLTAGGGTVGAAPSSRPTISAIPSEGTLPADGSADAEAWAVATFFDGQSDLFAAMRASSMARLAQDRRTLVEALRDADIAAARRQAHNLRSVLALIGRPHAAAAAESLEAALAASPVGDWSAAWSALVAHWPD